MTLRDDRPRPDAEPGLDHRRRAAHRRSGLRRPGRPARASRRHGRGSRPRCCWRPPSLGRHRAAARPELAAPAGRALQSKSCKPRARPSPTPWPSTHAHRRRRRQWPRNSTGTTPGKATSASAPPSPCHRADGERLCRADRRLHAGACGRGIREDDAVRHERGARAVWPIPRRWAEDALRLPVRARHVARLDLGLQAADQARRHGAREVPGRHHAQGEAARAGASSSCRPS